MKKATGLLFTGAFSAGCFALWMVLEFYGGIYRSLFYPIQHHDVEHLPPFSELIINCRLAILLMPLPFILYCVFSVFRKPLTSEGMV
ncbi:MAG: hypothetical protein WB421_06900, partial [Terriglobales bacterium]